MIEGRTHSQAADFAVDRRRFSAPFLFSGLRHDRKTGDGNQLQSAGNDKQDEPLEMPDEQIVQLREDGQVIVNDYP